jgi:hypothetical protein
MRKYFIWLPLMMLCAAPVLAQASGAATSPQSLRAIGVVTKIQASGFTLHTDAGPDVLVVLGEGVSFLRVPPGVTNLNSATKITLGDITAGDRVLVRGRASEDQKSIVASSVLVMAKSDLASAREAERLDWQRRGIRGTVQSVNPDTKEVAILAPTVPPTPGNATHLVTVSLGSNAVLLRYAPDSVKFSDAKPGSFQQIRVGDQVRALGTKGEDGNRFAAEKLVSGTFRTFGVTVVSVDPQSQTVNVTDVASGQPILVRTNGDSKLLRLPTPVAQQLAKLNTAAQEGKSGPADQPPDMEQILQGSPALDLGELKPGDSLMVVSTEGTKPSEVTAIDIFAGVEAIFAARPKDSKRAVLGPWSLGMNGGEGGP